MLNSTMSRGTDFRAGAHGVDIGDIYDAILEKTSLQALADVLHRIDPGLMILLYGQDRANLQGNFLIQRGMATNVERLYMTVVTTDDPYMAWQTRHPVGGIYDDADPSLALVAPHSRIVGEVLTDITGRTGYVGAVLHRADVRQLVLEMRHDDLGRMEIRRVLEMVVPHIVRALSVAMQQQAPALEGPGGDALLGFVPVPAFALDARCIVRARNEPAEEMLRRFDSVIRGSDGMLHARDAMLDEQMKAFTAAGRTGRHGSLLLASRSGDGSRLFVSMHAIPSMSTRYGPLGIAVDDGWRCLLVLDNASKPLRMDADVLWKTLGLTAAESDLAQSLLAGDTLGDCAARRHASKQSLRNTLLSVMRKTDTHRQAQLVALLTRLALHVRTS